MQTKAISDTLTTFINNLQIAAFEDGSEIIGYDKLSNGDKTQLSKILNIAGYETEVVKDMKPPRSAKLIVRTSSGENVDLECLKDDLMHSANYA